MSQQSISRRGGLRRWIVGGATLLLAGGGVGLWLSAQPHPDAAACEQALKSVAATASNPSAAVPSELPASCKGLSGQQIAQISDRVVQDILNSVSP